MQICLIGGPPKSERAFSFLTPHKGLCPWTPLGALPPDPRIGSRFTRSPCVRALALQLKISGAATVVISDPDKLSIL